MPERKPLVIDDTFITVPVTPVVATLLSAWVIDNLSDLNARLATHGLTANDLALPEWHRLVYVEDVEIRRQP